jgi:AmmeMemoRadiSam system protein B
MGSAVRKTRLRPPAVSGSFYPRDGQVLRATIERLLERAGAARPSGAGGSSADKALIVPHAGYVYSGPVAAAAYARLAPRRGQISRVIVIGPSHRAWFRGIAVPEAGLFATPLGEILVDPAGKARLLERDGVLESDAPHAAEHCIEVQLPFLQVVLGEFTLLPLLTGLASPAEVAAVLGAAWGGPETLIVVSSDLSHYHDYAAAQALDAQTAAAILARDGRLAEDQACGALAINGLLARAQQLDLAIEEIARLNSGDTAGDRTRVVGYGAWSLHDA